MLEIHREICEDEMLSVVCFKRLQGKKKKKKKDFREV